jgi:hypothetical protein
MNDFPIRLAGQRLSFNPRELRGLTASDITKRLRYEQTFPRT